MPREVWLSLMVDILLIMILQNLFFILESRQFCDVLVNKKKEQTQLRSEDWETRDLVPVQLL